MKNNIMYYTPSLAEFNDGFVFELRLNKEWIPCVFNFNPTLSNYTIVSFDGTVIGALIELKNTRVKFISAECLEDHGFHIKDDNEYMRMHPSLKRNELVSIKFLTKTRINVYLKTELKVTNIEVKNIQELLTLLKRLGLYE